MKKTALAFLPLWLALAPCPAQEAAVAPAAPAQAETVQGADAMARFCAILECHAAEQVEMARILATITDKETADAAAVQLDACLKRMAACEPDSEEAYDQLVAEVEKQGGNVGELITKYFDDKVGATYDTIQTHMAQLAALEPPFFGSEAMQGLASTPSILTPSQDDGESTGSETDTSDSASAGDDTSEGVTDEEEIADILEYSATLEAAITQLLAGVQDAASADKAAPQIAGFCYRMTADLLLAEAFAESHPDDPVFTGALPKLYAAAGRVLGQDTHGASTLRTALWGLDCAVSLHKDGKDMAEFADYLESRYFLSVYADRLPTALGALKDTTGADAAAAGIASRINRIRRCLAELQELGKGFDKTACEAWAKLALGATVEETEAAVRTCIGGFAALETPYYGSEKLKEALLRLDTPYDFEKEGYGEDDDYYCDECCEEAADAADSTYTTRQFEIGCSFMDEALSNLEPLKQVLLSVRDRASADAAAPKVIALRDAIDSVWSRMSEWMENENIPDELGDALLVRYADKLKTSDEVDAIISSLGAEVPAFFGSQTLHAALLMSEDGEGTEQ